MYFLLILFFLSLFGITFMIGRKLLLIQNGQIPTEHMLSGDISHPFEEFKHLSIKYIKKYGYEALVLIIRLYVRSANFLENKYQKLITTIKKMGEGIDSERKEIREASRFLKMISEYKVKVRKIRERVREEESL